VHIVCVFVMAGGFVVVVVVGVVVMYNFLQQVNVSLILHNCSLLN